MDGQQPMHTPLSSRLDVLAEAWNEAEIARPSLGRWLEQFDAADQPIALRLLECMQLHGWARLIRECRLLHERLYLDLAEDGFDVERCSDIDFTRAFVCKSGDLISYLYRKANRLPVTCFHNIEGLLASPPAPDQRRALVILDDTIGTAPSSCSPSWPAAPPTAPCCSAMGGCGWRRSLCTTTPATNGNCCNTAPSTR